MPVVFGIRRLDRPEVIRAIFLGVSTLVAGFSMSGRIYAAPEGGNLTPPPASPERLQQGRVLYSKHCASCHGPTGAGDGSAGHDLDPPPADLRDPDVAGKPDVKLFRQITRGRAPMPSFGRLLNDEDRWTLTVYVKTLGKGK